MKFISCCFQCLVKKEIKCMRRRWGISELYSSALWYGSDRNALLQESLKLWLWERSLSYIYTRQKMMIISWRWWVLRWSTSSRGTCSLRKIDTFEGFWSTATYHNFEMWYANIDWSNYNWLMLKKQRSCKCLSILKAVIRKAGWWFSMSMCRKRNSLLTWQWRFVIN